MPAADYLQSIVEHFEGVDPVWLLTGRGEPFIVDHESGTTQTGNFNQAGTSNKQTVRGNRGNVIGTNNGTAIGSVELEDCKRGLNEAQREIEYLRGQLKMQESVLAAKDETITLLRASFNRPN
jgi:hypothetical protein